MSIYISLIYWLYISFMSSLGIQLGVKCVFSIRWFRWMSFPSFVHFNFILVNFVITWYEIMEFLNYFYCCLWGAIGVLLYKNFWLHVGGLHFLSMTSKVCCHIDFCIKREGKEDCSRIAIESTWLLSWTSIDIDGNHCSIS